MQEGDTPAKQELQAVLDVLTTRPIVSTQAVHLACCNNFQLNHC